MNYVDALRNLVAFVLLKKREKHPWRSVTFSDMNKDQRRAQTDWYNRLK